MPTKVKFTYKDYLLTPEDKRYELIEGDLLITPSPIPYHQTVARKLFDILEAYVLKKNLGELFFSPIDVYFSEEDVVQPDILFIEKSRLSLIKEKYIQGPPDLVVEILTPSTKDRDLEIKRKLYAKYGVREYWIVDPEAKTIEVTVLKDSGLETLRVFPQGTRIQSLIFPALSFNPQAIF